MDTCGTRRALAPNHKGASDRPSEPDIQGRVVIGWARLPVPPGASSCYE